MVLGPAIWTDLKKKYLRTHCQDEFRSLSGCVPEILTACRMLQILIAWCQIEAEIRGFLTMYIMGGCKYGQNWPKTWFRPNFRPKNTNFSGHKFWTSDFGGVCGPKFWNFIIFDSIPTKCGYRPPKLAMGSYASFQNIKFNIIIHLCQRRTPKNTKKGIFSYFPQLLDILMP